MCALEGEELDSQDVVELFNLLPDSLAEDYYGVSFVVLEIIKENIALLKPISALRAESEWLDLVMTQL